MNSRSASIVGDQEAAGSSSYAWCNRQWLSSQALTRRSSVRPKQAVFNHNLLWLPESNGYPLCRVCGLGLVTPALRGYARPRCPVGWLLARRKARNPEKDPLTRFMPGPPKDLHHLGTAKGAEKDVRVF